MKHELVSTTTGHKEVFLFSAFIIMDKEAGVTLADSKNVINVEVVTHTLPFKSLKSVIFHLLIGFFFSERMH